MPRQRGDALARATLAAAALLACAGPAPAQTLNSVDTIVSDMMGPPDLAQDRLGGFGDPVMHRRRFGAWPVGSITTPNSAAIAYIDAHQRSAAEVAAGVNAATGKPLNYISPFLAWRPSADGTLRGWNNVVSWTWVHPGRDSRATNTAVELRHAEVYVLRASTGTWTKIEGGDPDPIPADAPHQFKMNQQADGSLLVSWVNRSSAKPYIYAQWSYAPLTGGVPYIDPTKQPSLPLMATSFTIPAADVKPGMYAVRAFYGQQSRLPAWVQFRLTEERRLEVVTSPDIQYPHGQQMNIACRWFECLPSQAGGGEVAGADGVSVRVIPRVLPNGSAISYELWNAPCAFCNSVDNPGYPDIQGDIKAVFATVQARLVSIDPDPAKDDRALARMYIEQGYDLYQFGRFTVPLDSLGKPVAMLDLTHMDGGVSRYKLISSEWQAFNVATVTNAHPDPSRRRPAMPSGDNIRFLPAYPYEPDVIDPIYGGDPGWNYDLGSPFDNTDYLLTIDQLRANPPPLR